MAMKARYTVMDGEILSQTRNGVKHHYVPDPLGNVVALYDTNQTKTDTLNHWPYGEEKSRTGSTIAPFGFIGKLGYFRDSPSRTYVRARYYRPDLAKWQTRDPRNMLEPENLYRYVESRPTVLVDPTGLQSQDIRLNCLGLNTGSYPGRCISQPRDPCMECCQALAVEATAGNIAAIAAQVGVPGPIVIPSARVASCKNTCIANCMRFPSGSIAMRDYIRCLLTGTISDYIIGLIVKGLIGYVNPKPRYTR